MNREVGIIHTSMRSRPQTAFTLLELLAVIAIIGILAGLTLSSVAKAKESARRVNCANNLRSIHLALRLYTHDNQGRFPPRRPSSPWTKQLAAHFSNPRVLECPTDLARPNPEGKESKGEESGEMRLSYVFNAFDDYVITRWGREAWQASLARDSDLPMQEDAIMHPSETIQLGERRGGVSGIRVHLLAENSAYLEVLEESRHGGAGSFANRGSNYAFADGSVRQLGFGESTCPVNRWAVYDQWRTNAALCRPR